ncbi:hypothetical protein ACN47E_008765 [Coniothyrium glycines]
MPVQARNHDYFPFEDLPGEIRNRIYFFARDEDFTSFLGLTQVSRLIRAEYRPMFRSPKGYQITVENLLHYLNVCRPGNMTQDTCDIAANVLRGNIPVEGIDVLPLFVCMHQAEVELATSYSVSFSFDPARVLQILYQDYHSEHTEKNHRVSRIVVMGGEEIARHFHNTWEETIDNAVHLELLGVGKQDFLYAGEIHGLGAIAVRWDSSGMALMLPKTLHKHAWLKFCEWHSDEWRNFT